MRQSAFAVAISLALLVTAGCNQSPQAPKAQSDATLSAPEALPEPVVEDQPLVLEDIVEATSDHLVGISYQGDATLYPGLAKALKSYADAARSGVIEAAASRPKGADAGSDAPYDLSLSFVELLDTPELVSWAADGSSYTGGAHGMPLLARFSWLPKQKKMLTATDLIPETAGWAPVSAYAREQLHTQLSQRIDADDPSPAERAKMMRNAGRMIDDGTAAKPENFAQFEPVAGVAGKLRGLRFVFPPYQVGPYSDGVQSVELPASVLLPHTAPEYRHLFEGGGDT